MSQRYHGMKIIEDHNLLDYVYRWKSGVRASRVSVRARRKSIRATRRPMKANRVSLRRKRPQLKANQHLVGVPAKHGYYMRDYNTFVLHPVAARALRDQASAMPEEKTESLLLQHAPFGMGTQPRTFYKPKIDWHFPTVLRGRLWGINPGTIS